MKYTVECQIQENEISIDYGDIRKGRHVIKRTVAILNLMMQKQLLQRQFGILL